MENTGQRRQGEEILLDAVLQERGHLVGCFPHAFVVALGDLVVDLVVDIVYLARDRAQYVCPDCDFGLQAFNYAVGLAAVGFDVSLLLLRLGLPSTSPAARSSEAVG
ncbi:hypothetical protein CA850_13530 [Micromonospora echinospora]|nr:hypothetical protein CA850_13530 [Micromonospora echinospora]